MGREGITVLEFDEAKHEYRWCGEVVPSVTQILKPLSDFSRIPPDVLERKRQIGTATHKAIELHLTGGVELESIDPAVLPYFNAFLRFEEENQFRMEQCETRVHHHLYRYAGTLDLIGPVKSGPLALIDLKTAAEFSPAWGPQTAAYYQATAPFAATMDRAALQLRDDGTYRYHRLTRAGDFATFLACLNIYNFQREFK